MALLTTMDPKTRRMRYGDNMNAAEILDIIVMINELENISEVEMTMGEATIKVVKGVSQVAEPLPGFSTPTLTGSPTVAEPLPGFSAPTLSGSPTVAPALTNQASPRQVKFALDLVDKLGNGNTTSVVNGLAHSLEVPVEDILHPDDWAEEMTRDHASLYLDVLEAQHKKMQKGAWG